MHNVHYHLNSLLGDTIKCADGDEKYVSRAINEELDFEEYKFLSKEIKTIGVTQEFKKVIDLFKVPEGETPAGFRVEYNLAENKQLLIDLKRDISCGKNGVKRATPFLFSADTANPYELAPMKDMIANLTCNPGIIYDLFINDPKENIGNKFKNRDEVMEEIGNILGPGCDISVEFNDPFADLSQLLEEAEHFREMLSEYRVVIKVPHTGAVTAENAHHLLEGNKRLPVAHNAGSTKDYFYSHNLALALKEHGFRVNYTLMFEPWQTGMALQAQPYFINSFVNKRMLTSTYVKGMLSAFDSTRDLQFLKNLRSYFVDVDFLPESASGCDLAEVEKIARETLTYRDFDNVRGFDGMDGVRHNLRMLRDCNLKDTRLIICSIAGTREYPELDKLLVEDEFKDVLDKIVITTEPIYFAQYTSSPQIITYQRRFLNAVNNTADKR